MCPSTYEPEDVLDLLPPPCATCKVFFSKETGPPGRDALPHYGCCLPPPYWLVWTVVCLFKCTSTFSSMGYPVLPLSGMCSACLVRAACPLLLFYDRFSLSNFLLSCIHVSPSLDVLRLFLDHMRPFLSPQLALF